MMASVGIQCQAHRAISTADDITTLYEWSSICPYDLCVCVFVLMCITVCMLVWRVLTRLFTHCPQTLLSTYNPIRQPTNDCSPVCLYVFLSVMSDGLRVFHLSSVVPLHATCLYASLQIRNIFRPSHHTLSRVCARSIVQYKQNVLDKHMKWFVFHWITWW